MNSPSVVQFPVNRQAQPSVIFVPESPSSRLTARIALGLHNATRTMCQHVHQIDHADGTAKKVAVLMLMEVIGRASMEPGTTVEQVLQVLFELAPEDSQAGGAA